MVDEFAYKTETLFVNNVLYVKYKDRFNQYLYYFNESELLKT